MKRERVEDFGAAAERNPLLGADCRALRLLKAHRSSAAGAIAGDGGAILASRSAMELEAQGTRYPTHDPHRQSPLSRLRCAAPHSPSAELRAFARFGQPVAILGLHDVLLIPDLDFLTTTAREPA